MMDKTLKLRALTDTAKNSVSKGNAAENRNRHQELARKDALLEEERSKSHELLKTIVQLRESLKQEQERSADLKARLTKLDAVEESQLVRKNAQLEEEKKKSLEHLSMIEQLQENIKQLREGIQQDQVKKADLIKLSDELKNKRAEMARMEDKVKELSGMLKQIAAIAGAAHVGDKS